MKDIKVVIGANFGDEGKGLMTDYFADKAKEANESCVVVLHNGGAQRGHTVVTPEGYRHVFKHFGSGTYVGAATYIAKEFIVNPAYFRKEYESLSRHLKMPEIYINPNCKLTTIYDMLINQVLEIDRGSGKHGSCGSGIFETLYRNQNGIDFVNTFEYNPLRMTVGEFNQLSYISKVDFLNFIRKSYVPKRFDIFGLKNISVEFTNVLLSDAAIVNFIDDFSFMMNNSSFANDEVLNRYDSVIFENGQGLLLDQHNRDYFPHLSPSNTGLSNPTEILNGLDYTGIVEACYVSRTYMTRHGVGRFDTECHKTEFYDNMVDMTNVPNPFQDHLRYGKLNFMDLNKRVNKDILSAKGKFIIKENLAFTHMNEYQEDFVAKYPMKYHSYSQTRDGVYLKS